MEENALLIFLINHFKKFQGTCAHFVSSWPSERCWIEWSNGTQYAMVKEKYIYF